MTKYNRTISVVVVVEIWWSKTDRVWSINNGMGSNSIRPCSNSKINKVSR